jgi:hypothetical protein
MTVNDSLMILEPLTCYILYMVRILVTALVNDGHDPNVDNITTRVWFTFLTLREVHLEE